MRLMRHWVSALLVLSCADAKVVGARRLFGAEVARAPHGSTRARPVLPVAARPQSVSSTAARRAPPAWAQRWNVTTPGRWFSGVALYNDSATFACSAGDWYNPPYPFGVTTAPLAAPLSNATTPTVPGSVWPVGGTQPTAVFVGMNFTTYAPVVSDYDREGRTRWADNLLSGVSGSSFYARGSLGASAAANGRGGAATVAYGVTLMARYDPTGPKHAEVAVVSTPEPPAAPSIVVADAFGNGTGIETVLLSADGATCVAVAARTSPDAPGTIVGSEVRVYDLAPGGGGGGGARSAFVTGWVSTACLSEDGATLVLATAEAPDDGPTTSTPLVGTPPVR